MKRNEYPPDYRGGTRIIIAGGRNYHPSPKQERKLRLYIKYLKVGLIISGMARGADTFGKDLADKMSIPCMELPAEWKRHGRKRAGFIRNNEMTDFADIVVLFPGGKGTKDMERISLERGLKVIRFK